MHLGGGLATVGGDGARGGHQGEGGLVLCRLAEDKFSASAERNKVVAPGTDGPHLWLDSNMSRLSSDVEQNIVQLCKTHCRLVTLSRRQKPTLAGRRYRSMSPAGRQRLQFYNEFVKW